MRPDRTLKRPAGYMELVADQSADHRFAATLLPDDAGLEGYLTLTYQLADRGLFFLPGAFKKTVNERLHKMHHLYMHWEEIGKHTSAVEDKVGLRVTAKINEDLDRGRAVMSNYRFGMGYGWSVGFTAIRDRSGKKSDEAKLDRSMVPQLDGVPIEELRAIEEAMIFEGSTVLWGSLGNAGPDVIQSTDDFDADMVATLLEALTNGTATPGQLANAERIADAWRDRAAAGGPLEAHHGTRHEGDGDGSVTEQQQTRLSLVQIRAKQAEARALIAKGIAA